MSKVSPKNIAEAIYEATEGKSGASLAPAIKNSVQILHSKRMLGKSEEVLKEFIEQHPELKSKIDEVYSAEVRKIKKVAVR